VVTVVNLDDYWDAIWNGPTQAEVDAQVKREVRGRAMQELAAAIANWRAEDPATRTCRDAIAAELLWLRDTFDRSEPA
jgi:hypothetical protein